MTLIDPAPIATAVLDMVLLNDDHESVLRMGNGPQSLRLVLTNLSDVDIELGDGHGTTLGLTFRPGALDRVDEVGAGGDGWTGGLVPGRTVLQTLVLTRSDVLVLEPHVPHEIEITGLVPSAAGGSRSTRVEVEYRDVHIVGEGPVAGRRILHLSLLHDRVPTGAIQGSFATSGPFAATLLDSSDVVTGGVLNRIRLGLSAATPVTVAGGADDVKGRFTIHTPQSDGDDIAVAEVGTTKGKWSFDSLSTNVVAKYDAIEEMTLDGDFLNFDLDIVTSNEPGIYPLYIKYENFGDTDGEIVLLLNITAIGVAATEGALTATRALTVNGDITATQYRTGSWRIAGEEHGGGKYVAFRAGDAAEASFYLIDRSDSNVAELGNFGAGRSLALWSRTGKVGVNNRSPAYTLDVAGTARAETLFSTGSTTTASLQVNGRALAQSLVVTGSTTTAGLQVNGRARAQSLVVTGSTTTAGLQVNGEANARRVMASESTTTARLTITGYSTNSSGTALVIGDTSKKNLRLGSTHSWAWIQSHGPSSLAINPGGNYVGINKSDPKHDLDVKGRIALSGHLVLSHGWRIVVTGDGRQLQFTRNNKVHLFIDSQQQTTANIKGAMWKIGS